MRHINEVIIHCTATPTGQHVTIGDINNWHNARGFGNCGYHYVIDYDGKVLNGRPEDEQGAHCQGHNARSIGIAYIGGMDAKTRMPKDTRTKLQK